MGSSRVNVRAEVGDVDLSQPLSPADLAAIKQAFWDYAVLIFPGQEYRSSSTRVRAVHRPLGDQHLRLEYQREITRNRGLGRRLESRRGERDLGREEPRAYVAAGQPAVAHLYREGETFELQLTDGLGSGQESCQ
jgi:hypothetical protein